MFSYHRYLIFLLCVLVQNAIPSCQAQTKLSAGLSIPIGDFALADSLMGGYAQTGLSVGVETQTKFYFGSEIGLTALLSYHPVDGDAFLRDHRNILPGSHLDAGSWILFWPMMSLGYSVPVTGNIKCSARGLGGILFGASPDMTVNTGGMLFTQNMALVITSGWGGMAGVTIGKIDLNVRYLYGRPEYSINVQGQGTSTERRSLYVTETIQVLLGIVL